MSIYDKSTGTYPTGSCVSLTAGIQTGKYTIGTSTHIYLYLNFESNSRITVFNISTTKTIPYDDYYYCNSNLTTIKPNDAVYLKHNVLERFY